MSGGGGGGGGGGDLGGDLGGVGGANDAHDGAQRKEVVM